MKRLFPNDKYNKLYAIVIFSMTVCLAAAMDIIIQPSVTPKTLQGSNKLVGKMAETLPSEEVPESLRGINATIIKIDTLLANAPNPNAEPQLAAKLAWNMFKMLCEEGRYREAYDYYYADGHEGDILVYLRTSTAQYAFFIDVIDRINKVYDSYESFLRKSRDNHELNLKMTELVISLSSGKNVPPHYLSVLLGTILTNARLGDFNRAEELMGKLRNVVLLDDGTEEEADDFVSYVSKMIEQIKNEREEEVRDVV